MQTQHALELRGRVCEQALGHVGAGLGQQPQTWGKGACEEVNHASRTCIMTWLLFGGREGVGKKTCTTPEEQDR